MVVVVVVAAVVVVVVVVVAIVVVVVMAVVVVMVVVRATGQERNASSEWVENHPQDARTDLSGIFLQRNKYTEQY